MDGCHVLSSVFLIFWNIALNVFGERLRGEVFMWLLFGHFASGCDYMFTAIGKPAACARGQQNPDTVGCVISCEITKDFQKRVFSCSFCNVSTFGQ